jgi:hypothetical protein
MIDVKNKRCEREGCGKTPNFAIDGEKPRFCSAHKVRARTHTSFAVHACVCAAAFRVQAADTLLTQCSRISSYSNFLNSRTHSLSVHACAVSRYGEC